MDYHFILNVNRVNENYILRVIRGIIIIKYLISAAVSDVPSPVSRALLLPLPFLYNPLYDFVTVHEFLDFYSGVSSTIHQDAWFDLFMRRAWAM